MSLLRRKQQVVEGIVDLYKTPVKADQANYPTQLYQPAVQSITQELQDDFMRTSFFNPNMKVLRLCVRPLDTLNVDPRKCWFVASEYEPYLRLGDIVEVTVRETTITEDDNVLGVVTNVLSRNNGPVTLNDDRPAMWQTAEHTRQYIGLPLFEGPTTTLLTLTGCVPDEGSGCSIIAVAKAGKTYLLRMLAAEAVGYDEIVAILSERPEENKRFLDLMTVGDAQLNGATLRVPARMFIAWENHAIARKLHNVAVGLNYGMRQAEMDRKILIIIDSVTAAIADPINQLSSGAAGIQKGGVNPLVGAAISLIMGIRGKYEVGSITMLITMANSGDAASFNMIGRCRKTGTCDISLEQKLANQAVYPAISFAPVHARSDTGEDIVWEATDNRLMQDWAGHLYPGIMSAIRKLRLALSVDTHYLAVLEKEHTAELADTRYKRRQDPLLRDEAYRTAADKYRKLLLMIRDGRSWQHIFEYFQIYDYREPGSPAEPELVFPASEDAKPDTPTSHTKRRGSGLWTRSNTASGSASTQQPVTAPKPITPAPAEPSEPAKPAPQTAPAPQGNPLVYQDVGRPQAFKDALAKVAPDAVHGGQGKGRSDDLWERVRKQALAEGSKPPIVELAPTRQFPAEDEAPDDPGKASDEPTDALAPDSGNHESGDDAPDTDSDGGV